MNTLTTEKVIQQQKKLHGTRLPKKGKVADSLMVSAMKELLGDLQNYTQNYRSTYLCLSQPRSRTTSCVTASYIKIRMHHTAKQQLPKLLVQTSANSWRNWSFSVNSKKLIHIVTCGKNQTKKNYLHCIYKSSTARDQDGNLDLAPLVPSPDARLPLRHIS